MLAFLAIYQQDAMKVFVNVKPHAKMAKVERVDHTHFIIAVQQPPIEGKANDAVRDALAKYFSVPRSRVTLLSGYRSRQKVFEVVPGILGS